ncbi:MAG: T9SS type A sorting domain-containing protein [Rhodothermales bacterium]|nr:T9SS type A sorting domain-containing protein [Rhodothermales bacterium]
MLLTVVDARGQHAGHDLPGHVCGTDATSPEALEALANFRQARERGDLAIARKSASPPDIGDQRPFKVSEDSWVEMDFELIDKEDGLYYLWAEVGEIASGRITADVIAELRSALVESTPGSIINENAGVIANNEAVLGPPPDYDGDGVTDVLMYDIDPGSDGGSFVAGYVHSADINPNASPGIGNQADILYLDSNQGIRNGTTPGTAAHEYAHLIHFATGFDNQTFISEGIAEYLTIVNGLGRSRYGFLGITEETEKPLFSWGQGSSIVRDYARAELFMRYIGEQFSPETVSAIAANPYKGADGIDSVLTAAGSSLAEVVMNYHAANLVNDARLGAAFVYSSQVEASGARATIPVTYGGGSAGDTPPFADGELPGVESGAAAYFEFKNVADLRISFDAAAAPVILPAARESIGGRIFFQDEMGTWSTQPLDPQEGEQVFPGNYFKARVVVANKKPGRTFVTRYNYDASWAAFGQATPTEDAPELPSRVALDQNYPNPFNPVTNIAFSLPQSTDVRLFVVDLLGRRVATVADGAFPAGEHTVRFSADRLPSGTYLYVLEAAGERMTKQLTLLK